MKLIMIFWGICLLAVGEAVASLKQLRDSRGSHWPETGLRAVRTFYEALSAGNDRAAVPDCCVFKDLDVWGKIGHVSEPEMRALVWRYICSNRAFFMSEEAVSKGESPLAFFERAEIRFETPITRNSSSVIVIRERKGSHGVLNEIMLPIDGLFLPDDPRNETSSPRIGLFGFFLMRDGRYLEENFAEFFAKENVRVRIWLWFYNRRVNANKDLRGKKD